MPTLGISEHLKNVRLRVSNTEPSSGAQLGERKGITCKHVERQQKGNHKLWDRLGTKVMVAYKHTKNERCMKIGNIIGSNYSGS